MQKKPTDIDRKTASKLLGVSVRTIDRYIRNGKLFAHTDNGRIWLNKRELLGFPVEKTQIRKPTIDRQKPKVIKPQATKKNDGDFYRDLYEEAKRALQEYQQKLEQSNYRIGQLESQNIHPLPLPKITEHYDDSMSHELLRKERLDHEKEIFMLKESLKKERTNRIVFSVITYILLILQPIFWYLLK